MTLNKKWMLSLFFILLASIMVACNDNGESKETKEEQQTEDEKVASEAGTEMADPDLEGIPDVVAEVNGKKIMKDDFEANYVGQYQQVMLQSQMSGEEVDQSQLKEMVLESMIGQELLIQKAENSDLSASETEVNALFDQLVAQNGLQSKDEFIAAMEEQGMDKAEVNSLLERQVKVDQLIAAESGDIEPTDQELEEYYEMLKSQQEQQGGDQEIPTFDEIRENIKEQVKNEKEAEVTQSLVDKLREDAQVKINI